MFPLCRVIDYVQSRYRSFSYRQEGDIKRYISGQPDKRKAAETVYNASLPFLNREECERVKGQLADADQSEEKMSTVPLMADCGWNVYSTKPASATPSSYTFCHVPPSFAKAKHRQFSDFVI